MTPPAGILVIGAGGHAKVVIETARASGYVVAGLVDSRLDTIGKSVMGVPVIGGIDSIRKGSTCVVAIGDGRTRERVVRELADTVRWATLVHPRAVVAEGVLLGAGSVVFAMAVVQPAARVGAHAIINTASVVEHDNDLDDFAQVATGARLTGGVAVELGGFIGAGAVVLPGVRVGRWSVVGAGSVVTRDVLDGRTVAGVPATVIGGDTGVT